MQKKAKAIGILCAGLLTVATAACSRVNEPWVPNSDTLKEERARPADQQQDLRGRLMTSQVDR
jgi:hypothetical protein